MTLTNEYQYIGRSNAVRSSAGYEYYTLLYAKTAGDIATGKHTVSVRMRLACSADSTFYGWQTTGHAAVAGVSAFAWSMQNVPAAAWPAGQLVEGGITYRRWTDLIEGTASVYTGWGAEKEVVIDTAWVMNGSSTKAWFPATGVPANASITVTLPMIAGATTPVLSASAVELGKPLTITTKPMADGFTHTLRYTFGTASGEIGNTWTPDLSLAAQIPNSDSGTAVITCTTYHGGAKVGEPVSVPVTLKVPSSVKPTATAAWTDTSGAFDRLGMLVQNVSKLNVTVTGTGAWGSTITNASVSLAGKAYNGGVITGKGSMTLTATVKDSRGRTGTASYTLTLAEYAAPSLTLSASRCSADGTHDDTGEFAHITVSGTVAALTGNSAQLQCAGHTVALSTGPYSREWVVPADSNKTLSITASVSDKLLTTTRSMTLSTGFATMDFLKGGRGIAFGATATKEGFTCAMDTDLSGHRLTGLAAPAGPTDGVNLGYLTPQRLLLTRIDVVAPGKAEYVSTPQLKGYTALLWFGDRELEPGTYTAGSFSQQVPNCAFPVIGNFGNLATCYVFDNVMYLSVSAKSRYSEWWHGGTTLL